MQLLIRLFSWITNLLHICPFQCSLGAIGSGEEDYKPYMKVQHTGYNNFIIITIMAFFVIIERIIFAVSVVRNN